MRRLGNKKLVSICIPVLDESENLLRLFSTLEAFAEEEVNYDFEFLFTDNASQDSTWSIIKQKSLQDTRYRGMRFTKNIGFNNSILVNFQNARGDALVQFDADLQDPILIVSEFLRKWECGFKVVVGLRAERSEAFFLNQFRRMGYRVLRKVSKGSLLVDVGDFKLLDREIVQRLIVVNTPDPYLRGIIAEMNYPTAYVPYRRELRIKGYSKFNFPKLVLFGLSAVTDHSKITTKALWIAFASLTILNLALSVIYIWQALHSSDWPQGLLTLYILQLATIQFILFSTAILSTFLIRIYSISTGMPRYHLLDKTHNFD